MITNALDLVHAAAEPASDAFDQTLDLLRGLVRRFQFEQEHNVGWHLSHVTEPAGSVVTLEFDHYFGSDSRMAYVYRLHFNSEHKKITVSSVVTHQRLTSDHVTTSPHLTDRTFPLPATGEETVRWFLNLVVHDLHGENARINNKPVHFQAHAAAEPVQVLNITKREVDRWVASNPVLKVQGTNVGLSIRNTYNAQSGRMVLELHQFRDGADGFSANYAFAHLNWSKSKSVTTLKFSAVRHDTTEYNRTYNIKHVSLERLLAAVFAEYFRSREGKIFLTNDVDTTERHRIQKLRAGQARAATEPGAEITAPQLQDLLLDFSHTHRFVVKDASDQEWMLDYVEHRDAAMKGLHLGFTLRNTSGRTLQFLTVELDAYNVYVSVRKKATIHTKLPQSAQQLVQAVLALAKKLIHEHVRAPTEKVKAAAEPPPQYNLGSLERDLNHVPAPVYQGVCNHNTEVRLQFFECEDLVTRYGYEQLAFEVNVYPQGEELQQGCAFVFVRLHENKLEVLSTRPAIGMEWGQVLYHKTFKRPELLTARFIQALLDRELRRTNYYENFARWASGLKPMEMKP